jgi:hypothetical protein
MEEKFVFIEQLIAKGKSSELVSYNYLVHAIYYTIDINPLIKLYINTNNQNIKKSLDFHLSKRFKDDTVDLRKVFNGLFRILKTNHSHKTHQRIRSLLSKFISKLPRPHVQKYFNYFSSTQYKNDLSAALKVSNMVWNPESDDIFISRYLDTLNDDYLHAVLNNGNTESIMKRLAELWEEEYPSDYLKTKILRKIAPTYMHKLDFLKKGEPDKYLYAACIASQNITDSEARNLFNALHENQKSFGLWCLGKLGKWNLLKESLAEYIS